MTDEQVAENIYSVYNHIIHTVKEEKNNIRNIIVKFSMGRPFIIGKKYLPDELKQKERTPKNKPYKKDKAKSDSNTNVKIQKTQVKKEIIKEDKE